MSVTANKHLMQGIFDQLAQGNARPFIEAMSDDVVWHVTGTTPFSKSYRGKATVLGELLQPLTAQFANAYVNRAQRFIAEDDHVAVMCQGEVMLKSGKPYNNSYCWVCRIADGRIVELTEYLDTQLVMDVLR